MATTAVLKSRHHPKLLSLQHVESLSDDCCSLSAPMTPLAGDVGLLSATVSPRDPAMKLAAAAAPMNKKPASAAGPSGFSSHRLNIRNASSSASSSSSDETSSEAEEDDEDDDSAAHETMPCKPVKGNTGRWTEAEHKLFLQGLETFPYRAWKKIATLIKTRTVVQIRTHAQKYYQKLEKEEARMKEREQQLTQHQDRPSSLASSSSAQREAAEAVVTPMSSPSAQKKKHLMRKRKSSSMLDLDTESDASEASAPLPSLPKRMAREKKFAAHMSPKQKVAAVSSSSAKMFFGSQFSSPEFSAAASPELHARLSSPFSRGSKMAAQQHLQQQQVQQQTPPEHHALPLDFVNSAAESMILDFADEKSVGDYAFSLDGSCMDQGLSSIDNDDLLQLTEEEMDWFTTTSSDQDMLKSESESKPSSLAAVSGVKSEEDASSLSLDRFQFAEVDADELVRLDEATDVEGAMTGLLSSGSSPSLSDSVYTSDLCLEDEDFVLDPEKFLSSYFSPADAAQS